MLATATRPDITVSPPAAAVVNPEAVAKNDVDGVAAYVKSGKTVHLRDPTGMTPLHYAAQQGHAKVVEVLIAAGADADARTTGTNLTPLWLARTEASSTPGKRALPGCKVNPGPARARGRRALGAQGAVSAARAARQEHHDDVADFIEAAAPAAA
ncbi:hypothetical protein JL721_10119 [Aureococcus anophagefferens]|nr:hypothetical protein JL721_10119 [Aureococcus anophagefferens]